MSTKSTLGIAGFGNASKKIKSMKDKDYLDDIELSIIDFDKDQYRNDISDYDLEGLAASIDNVGLIKPIKVEAQPDGRFLIVDGEMRKRAKDLLFKQYEGKKHRTIQCLVHADVSIEGLDKRTSRDIIQISANHFHDPGSVFDVANKLVSLEKSLGSDELKKFLADHNQPNSRVNLSRWRALARVSEQLKSDLKNNDIKDKDTLLTLNRIYEKSPEDYSKLIAQYKNDELPVSIAKATKLKWQELSGKQKVTPNVSDPKDLNEGSLNKASKTAQSSVKSNLDDGFEMKIQASTILARGNALVINTPDNQLITISLPKKLKVKIIKE
ncbi:ParB N-terminal domain-containing protein [Thalassotalea marina]|uniref:ParB-like N-terminal domain-containing protein n=1 Tax=Thalassotalea marina TaxID=1673741 RepID=A0A919ENK5_9GAMM|nr:ParB N-terminal domain-containing protein [Thalassotalea marina]GHG06958.1 hypothetical protein GCM10017161_40710 [Thalassotalea marina]